MDEELKPKTPGAAPQQPQQPMTFSRMQQQGYARPAPPGYGGQRMAYGSDPSQRPPSPPGQPNPMSGSGVMYPGDASPQASVPGGGSQIDRAKQLMGTARGTLPPPRPTVKKLTGPNEWSQRPGMTDNPEGDPMITDMLKKQLQAPGFQAPQNKMLEQMMPAYLKNTPTFTPGQDQGLNQRVSEAATNFQGYGLSSNPALGQTINSQAQNFQGYQNPVQMQQQQLMQESLQNPSAYTTQMFKNNLNQANQALDEQYGLDKNSMDQQMAKRGLYNSTMAVGQLGDLGVQHERSKANMAQNLLTQQAQGYQNDRASALGAGNAFANQGLSSFMGNAATQGSALDRASGYQNSRDTLGLNTFATNQSIQGQNLDRNIGLQNSNNEMGLNAFNANNNEAAQRMGIGMQYGQNQFNNASSAFGMNENTNQSRLNQAMDYDKSIYDRSWQNNLLNNQNDQSMMNFYLRSMGL